MLCNIAIAGANGRMGRMLITAAKHDIEISNTVAFNRGDDVASLLRDTTILIDFTRPDATMAHIAACEKLGVNTVIGTTGFTADEKKRIAEASKKIAIVLAPNTSLGVNVTATLVEMAARSLGMAADIEVFDAHHKMKVDAPSGTALMLGETAAAARGQNFSEVARYEASGAREAGTIGFSALRAGDIIGEHTVFFVLDGERIEITHKSQSRATYALGALRAAKFLLDKTSGLYDMQDVLGLKT
jgi:4-hydroxy-tetrahydrodipicolinate reductase